jgi:hypothetical protein
MKSKKGGAKGSGGGSRSTITAQEYDDLTHLLKLHLRTEEEAAEATVTAEGIPVQFAGVTWQSLCTWYLQQVHSLLFLHSVFFFALNSVW